MRRLVFPVVLVLLISACSSSGDDAAPTTALPPSSATTRPVHYDELHAWARLQDFTSVVDGYEAVIKAYQTMVSGDDGSITPDEARTFGKACEQIRPLGRTTLLISSSAPWPELGSALLETSEAFSDFETPCVTFALVPNMARFNVLTDTLTPAALSLNKVHTLVDGLL